MSRLAQPIKLIATDLDGTLLHSNLGISPRARHAIAHAHQLGIPVIPVTARQPFGLQEIAQAAGFNQWALCNNGAQGIHLATGQVLFEKYISVEAQSRLAHQLLEHIPGLLFVSIRSGGRRFLAQQGYAQIAQFSNHKRHPKEMGAYSLEEVLAQPSLKLIIRHPTIPTPELWPHIQNLPFTGLHITHSGAPFLEVMAEGITKAWGVKQLCHHLNIPQHAVLALGDAPNDTEMLAWAGHGIAMANAHPEVQAAADQITLSNDEDGWAIAVEQIL